MNEIKKEYGWITAITPEEIKALGKPKSGDEVFVGPWIVTKRWQHEMDFYPSLEPVRRPIDPGEGFELVPESDVIGVEINKALNLGWEPTYDGGKSWLQHALAQSSNAVRRRKTPASPAMEEGWESVPKEEVNTVHGFTMKGWQFFNAGDKTWMNSGMVHREEIYRRPISKPAAKVEEKYGWLKADCGVAMPLATIFHVKLQDGREVNVIFSVAQNGYVFSSSAIPIDSPIAYWFRMPPAPEVEKVDPCESAWNKLRTMDDGMNSDDFIIFSDGWIACEAHYHVGDQSKGAK